MTNNKRSGFTLIEMLVVVAIIGLLSSVVVVGVGSARKQARDARRISDIRQIQNLLENAYSGTGEYPQTLPTNAPSDPSSGTYTYVPGATTKAQTYGLGTCLEADRPTGVGNSSDAFTNAMTNAGQTCTCAGATKNVYCVKS